MVIQRSSALRGTLNRLRGVTARASAANLVQPITAALAAPIIAQAVGADGRGQIAAIMTPLLVSDGIGAMGLPLALNFFRAKGYGVSSLIKLSFGPFVLGAAASYVLLFVLVGRIAGEHNISPILLISLWSLAPISLAINAIRGLRIGEAAWTQINLDRVVSGIGRLVIVILLIAAGAASAATISIAYIALPMLTALVLLKQRRVQVMQDELPRNEFNSYTLTSIPNSVLSLLSLRLDSLILALIATTSVVGIYAMATTLAEIPSVLYTVVAQMLFTRAAQGASISEIRKKFFRTIAATTLAAVSISLAIQPIATALFGDEFADLRYYTPLMALGVVFLAAGSMISFVLGGYGHPLAGAAVPLSFVVFLVPVLPALTSPLGGFGACVAVCICRFASLIVGLFLLFWWQPWKSVAGNTNCEGAPK